MHVVAQRREFLHLRPNRARIHPEQRLPVETTVRFVHLRYQPSSAVAVVRQRPFVLFDGDTDTPFRRRNRQLAEVRNGPLPMGGVVSVVLLITRPDANEIRAEGGGNIEFPLVRFGELGRSRAQVGTVRRDFEVEVPGDPTRFVRRTVRAIDVSPSPEFDAVVTGRRRPCHDSVDWCLHIGYRTQTDLHTGYFRVDGKNVWSKRTRAMIYCFPL